MNTLLKQSYPILYSFRRCPYAIRARMALLYSGIVVELREVDLKNKPKEMLAISPKGTVPILVVKNDNVLDQSIDIINWALSQHDPDGRRCINESEHSQTDELINENDTSFKYYLDRYKYSDRYPNETVEFYKQNAEFFLSKLEDNLTKHKFLVKNEVAIADICIFPFVRQYCIVDKQYFEKSPYSKLKRWLNYFSNSNEFLNVMKKYNTWSIDSTIDLL